MSPQPAWPPRKKIITFLLLCFGASWAVLGAYLATGRPWSGGVAAAVSVFYGFPPGIAALAVRGALSGEMVKDAFGISLRPNRWFLVAWMAPVVLVFLTAAIALLFPGSTSSFSTEDYLAHFREHATPEQLESIEASANGVLPPYVRDVFRGMLSGATLGGALAMMQELAWRGFLHAELPQPALRKAALIGLVWAAWRAPIVWIGAGPVHPALAVLLMTVWCVVASVLFGVVRDRSRSLLAVAIFHGTINGTAGVAPLLTGGVGPEIAGIHGVAGIAATSLIAGAVLWIHRTTAQTSRGTPGTAQQSP